jgi:hypothetical protein
VDNYDNPDANDRSPVMSPAALAQTVVAQPPRSFPADPHPSFPQLPVLPGDLGVPALAGPRGYGIQMKRRRPAGVWLLTLCTLGIYGLAYWYRVHAELREFDRRRHVSPVFELLSISLLAWTIILPLMSIGSMAERIRLAQSAAGLPQGCSGRKGILLALLFGTHVIYYQGKLNGIIAMNDARRGERIELKI